MQALDIAERFAALGPAPAESAAVLAGQSVRLLRLRGEGSWHCHTGSDETVLVWAGRFRVEYRDGGNPLGADELGAGQVCVVPAGREHRGVADEGADVVLFRPA